MNAHFASSLGASYFFSSSFSLGASYFFSSSFSLGASSFFSSSFGASSFFASSFFSSFGASSLIPSIPAASLPTISPYFVACPASSAGMSFHDTFGVSGLQYAARHLEMPTHEQLNSPTTHFCSSTGTAVQHSPREALIMSAVHQRGIGSSGSSKVFIKIG